MLKSLINKYLKAVLSELFINHSKDSFQFSVGADLFSDSNVNLKNLTFRPDLFDAHLYPIKLVFGHLNELNITGIAELALAGGKVKVTGDNIFLLFHVESSDEINPEYLQYLKKVMIELSTLSIQHVLIRELLKKVQCISGTKDPDFRKQRLLILKLTDYLFKNFYINFRNIHIRIETPCVAAAAGNLGGSPHYCCAVGMTIPFVQISPRTQSRPEGVGKDDPVLGLSITNLQIYCDYNCETYLANGDSLANILKQFLARKNEVHTAMLLPFDLEIVLAAEIKKRSGLVSPKISVNIPKLRIACDYKQLEVIQLLVELYHTAKKRCNHLVNLRATFGKDGPPKLAIIGGNHILPTLSPGYYRIPPAVDSNGGSGGGGSSSRVVALLQARVGSRWKKALWKHIIRVIIHDVRLARPLGRWCSLVRLCLIRKEYAFIYSRLLKRSSKSGNFVYNVNARMDMATYKKLFDYDMALPVATIMQFRTLATMICIVELFNGKRQQARGGSSGGGGGVLKSSTLQPYERIGILWRDVLLIHSELIEAQRESAFQPRSKTSSNEDDENEDDSASVVSGTQSRVSADDTASVFSFSSRSNRPNRMVDTVMAGPAAAASILNSTARLLPKSLLQVGGSNGTIINAGGPIRSTTQQSGGSVFGGNSNANISSNNSMSMSMSSAIGADDLDTKLFGRKEMSAFSEFVGTIENEEKRSEGGTGEMIGGINGTPIKYSIYNWNLPGESPLHSHIVECTQNTLLRHQQPLTIVPPDISLSLKTFDFHLRKPLENGVRQTLAILNAVNFDVALSITDSHSSGAPSAVSVLSSATKTPSQQQPKKSEGTMLLVKSLHGFASIIGSLVQVRLTLQALSIQAYVHNKDVISALGGVITLDALATGSGRGITVDAITGSRVVTRDLVRGDDDDWEEEGGHGDTSLGYKPSVAVPMSGGGGGDGAAVDGPPPRSVGAPPMPGTPAFETRRLEELRLKEKQPLALNLLLSSGHPFLQNDVTSRSPNSSNKSPSPRQQASTFLTVCLMLDFDDSANNEGGAADLQIYLGSAQTEFSSELFSFIADDVTRANYNRIIEILTRLDQLRFLQDEEAWYIDAELQMPYVEALLNYLYSHDPFYTASATAASVLGSISASDHANSKAFAHSLGDNGRTEADELNSSTIAQLNNSSSASCESDDDDNDNNDGGDELEYEKEDNNEEASASEDDDQLSDQHSRDNNLDNLNNSSPIKGGDGEHLSSGAVISAPHVDKSMHMVPDFSQPTSYGKGRHSGSGIETEKADLQRRQMLIRKRRLLRREYLNFEFYRTYLKSLIPSVCSVCFRSSAYTIDLLTSQTLERLIVSMTNKLADKDSQVQSRVFGSEGGGVNSNKRSADTTSLFGINFMQRSYAGILVSSLQEMRNSQNPQLQSLNAAAAGAMNILTDRKIHLDVPGLELVMIKKMKPVQDLFVRLLAIEMKIPIAEKTLFDLIALMLQSNTPHYK